jgi:hypothetical protein
MGKLVEKHIFKAENKKRTELGKLVYVTCYTLKGIKELFPKLQN